MAARRNTRKVVAKGLFPDATVMRGHDWEWDDQDGKNIIMRGLDYCTVYVVQ